MDVDLDKKEALDMDLVPEEIEEEEETVKTDRLFE